MADIILNESQSKILAGVDGPVRVRDDAGNVLGFVSPREYADDKQYVEDVRASVSSRSSRVERLIQEGLDSGEPTELTDDWWERKKTALSKLLGKEEDA